jgi:hypothetical protein
MMKTKKLVGFAGIVALVVGYAVYDYRSSLTVEKDKATQNRLFNEPADQISQFQIRSESGDIELKKDQDGWKMLQPVVDLADNHVADEFVEGIATESASETAVEGGEIQLSNFGLDRPKGTVSVTDNLGKKTEFKVGSLKNFQGDAFIQKNQDPKVLIASSTWFAKVEKKPVDFRDKRLMRFSNAKAEKISILKGKENFQLLKKEEGWVLSTHPDWKLDQNRVREILSMLNTTEILEFIAERDIQAQELKKWGLDHPRLQLKVDLRDHGSWMADFAAGYDKVHRAHVTPPNFVFKISPTDSDKFFQLSEDYFRDRSEPFNFDKSQVREVSVKFGKNSASFKADDDKIRKLISQVAALKIAHFQVDPKNPLTDEISLKGEKGDLLTLKWSKAKGEIVASSSLFPERFSLSEEDINNLKLDELFKKEGGK